MWALSWHVSPARPRHVSLIPNPTRPPCTALSRLPASASDANDVVGLVRTVFTSLESEPKPKQAQEKSKAKRDDQISGSDVLWAMARVADKKKKKKKTTKKRSIEGRGLLFSTGGRRGESGAGDDDDDDDVRPLVVKSEWAGELSELEKLLSELCETK